jgi:6-phosphogluconolactonase
VRVEVLADAQAASIRTAELIAREAHECVKARGRFIFAASGGTEPWVAFAHLATLDVPWASVHLLQVDERIAPDGSPDRNYTHLVETLVARVPIPRQQVHAMPVAAADERFARLYEDELRSIAGMPPLIDLVHLGIGPDGHTASLVPGDPVLDVNDREVALTGEYQGRRRMTLTYPPLDRARKRLWLVPGARKAEALARLLDGDRSIPAGRVSQANTMVVTDHAAMARTGTKA